MERVWEVLTDPVTLFTGLFLGVAAGLITTRVDTFVSSFPNKYRQRARRRRLMALRNAWMLSRDPAVMTMYLVVINLYATIIVGLAILAYSNPEPVEYFRVDVLERHTAQLVRETARFLLLMGAVYLSYLTIRRYDHFRIAWYYWRRHKFRADWPWRWKRVTVAQRLKRRRG